MLSGLSSGGCLDMGVTEVIRRVQPTFKQRWSRDTFFIPEETIFDEDVRERIADKVSSIKEIEIHTTGVWNCGRRLTYSFSGFPGLPEHWYSMKGWVGHEAIENFLVSGVEPDVSAAAIADSDLAHSMNIDRRIAEALSAELLPMMRNFHDWFDATDVDLSPSNILGKEVRLRTKLTERFFRVGTVDILCEDTIVDLKMGKKSYRMENYAQLGCYERDSRAAGLGQPRKRLLNLFCGGDKAEQLEPKRKSIQSALMKWDGALLTTMGNYGLLEKGEVLACSPGFQCNLCRWRHLCRAV